MTVFLIVQGRSTSLNVALNKTGQIDHCNDAVSDVSSNLTPVIDAAQDEEDMDVPEIVEEIIEMLLSGLRDMVCPKGEILIEDFASLFH